MLNEPLEPNRPYTRAPLRDVVAGRGFWPGSGAYRAGDESACAEHETAGLGDSAPHFACDAHRGTSDRRCLR